MGGGRGAIVAYTMPIWAALLSAWYLKERPTRRRLAALALGMVGIALLIGPDLLGLGQDPVGPLLMIGAAICWAAGIVVMKGERWRVGIMALTGWQLLLGGVPIVLAWLVIEPHPDLSRLTWVGALATVYANSATSAQTREAIAVVYQVLNDYAGSVGEVLGVSLFTALWLVIVSLTILRTPVVSRWIGYFGLVSATLLAVQLAELFGTDLGAFISVSVSVLQLWFLVTGIALLRSPRWHRPA
jgi:hypothetical protein